MQQENPFTLVTGAAVSAHRLVKLSGATAIHNTVTSTDLPIGVSKYAADSGAVVAIDDVKKGGTVELTASGEIAAGAAVYAAADGRVSALPAASGTYLYIGEAIEAATATGDVIEVYLRCNGTTTTV